MPIHLQIGTMFYGLRWNWPKNECTSAGGRFWKTPHLEAKRGFIQVWAATKPRRTETEHKTTAASGIRRHQAALPVYPGRTADYSSKDQHSMLCMAVSQAAWGGSNYPKARGNHQALVVSPSSLVWKSMDVMYTWHYDIGYLIYTTTTPDTSLYYCVSGPWWWWDWVW